MASTLCLAEDADRVILQGREATASFALAGGGLIELRLNGNSINPLNWEVAQDRQQNKTEKPHPQGHFLCLDRWGAPSKAELAKGIPFHGEAPYRKWKIKQAPTLADGQMHTSMTCELPLAGLEVERQVVLDTNSTAMVVSETVKNVGRLGRLYNMVQHPSIAPPFLDDTTIVNSNASAGFSQQGPIPDLDRDANRWPNMRIGGAVEDLRYFRGNAAGGTDGESDVSSFVFASDQKLGWVTAVHSKSRLLLGYLWSTADYPWLNIWRFRKGNSVLARGLEFGTTGYHQPFPVLVKQHKILDRQLYAYLDAEESHARSYIAFVAAVPEDFRDVTKLTYADGNIVVHEYNNRLIRIPLTKLPW